MLTLYDYWRSSAAYRVRIALNIKELTYEQVSIHLTKEGGQQKSETYRSMNPQGLVPVLKDGDLTINQSLSIIEYLEEKFPQPALLPKSPERKALARSISQMIACDIHPLNNLRILHYLKDALSVSDDEKQTWYQHWVKEGFSAIEQQLALYPVQGEFCLGNELSVADVCLIPQVYNAQRFGVDMHDFPRLCDINAFCLGLEAFKKAIPENQSDAQ